MDEYEKALMYHQAEIRAQNGYRPDADEISELEKEVIKVSGGFLLGLSKEFWVKFIQPDGSLDDKAILAAGYSEEQIEYIEEEMAGKGWLAEAPPPPAVESSETDSIESVEQ
jgi:hypothetical protein